MIRLALFAIGVAVVSGGSGDLRQLLVRDAERAAFAETCTHYRDRAGPGPHADPDAFPVFLANACTAAERVLDDGSPTERAVSMLLLSRIRMLDKTVERMNAERAGHVDAAISLTANAGDDTASRGGDVALGNLPVTETGEFLIAHRMGLFIAYNAWLDTGHQAELASYR